MKADEARELAENFKAASRLSAEKSAAENLSKVSAHIASVWEEWKSLVHASVVEAAKNGRMNVMLYVDEEPASEELARKLAGFFNEEGYEVAVGYNDAEPTTTLQLDWNLRPIDPAPFKQPRLKEVMDNESLQMILALTLDKLAAMSALILSAGPEDFTEQFMDVRDNIAWRD